MYINYRGMVNDRPLDTLVASPQKNDAVPPQGRPNFMDNVLAYMNNHNVVPVPNVPVYDKGRLS
jgi:hypothetical protein